MLPAILRADVFPAGITFRRNEDGLSAHAKISLTGADAAALLLSAARPPFIGSLGLTAEVEGTGLSPVALVGSLKGSGKIALGNAQIAGLDPRTFDAVTRAVDQGLPIEAGRISDLVSKSLESGQLSIKRAESAMQISAGQLRFSNVSAESKDAALSVAGTLDLTDGSIDARLVLSGSAEAAGARPKIFVALKGPLTAPSRSIDVSALTGWLTLRAVENQTKRLRAIESVPSQPRGRGSAEDQASACLAGTDRYQAGARAPQRGSACRLSPLAELNGSTCGRLHFARVTLRDAVLADCARGNGRERKDGSRMTDCRDGDRCRSTPPDLTASFPYRSRFPSILFQNASSRLTLVL